MQKNRRWNGWIFGDRYLLLIECILDLCAHSDRCFNLKSVDESFGHDHQEGNFG
jgi:hypothetical protein